jgi:hypothetical protein
VEAGGIELQNEDQEANGWDVSKMILGLIKALRCLTSEEEKKRRNV